MSNQSIRVNLMFDANVTAARNNIQQLATLLQQIATPKTVTVNGGAIQQAAQAAQSLQMHLQNAMNVNTGKLDLTKLNFSLKQAGLSLNDLSSKLVASGTQGQQAFVKLANAIAQAGAPAAQLNATVAQFLKTMSSAMMWNAAYGALQGVTDTIRESIDYAKDLNRALNDIAIVSELSAAQLDDFAVKAAKAAKTLNTTTTEYAKAALIFYQQGLSGKEVEERANVVTKLAQVTGESTQQVSDQLTAIWNNFDDGTKSLEYYADALAALGAATASSTDEITQGLEKFAAIAETVGLSYEYATAALATVTAETRQSADVVGTAFKTLFARIQDLELGETLDDGVTLGKYARALEAIGVNILDANNQIKDMDDILDAIGGKWDTLSQAQQTALAQTVAGMRQYTQFIAIMDNYDEFKINVDIASNAEGTLTEQWETWADSYEAAAKRIEQRKNELYEALLDDEFVIGVTDSLAGLIGSIGKAVDAMGGLGPIILTIIGLFSTKLIPVISNAATHFVQNWRVMSGAAQQESLRIQESMRQQTKEYIRLGVVAESQVEALQLTNELSMAKENLAKASKYLSKAQQEEYQQRMNNYEAGVIELQKLIEITEQKKKEAEAGKRTLGMLNQRKIVKAGENTISSMLNQKDDPRIAELIRKASAAEKNAENAAKEGNTKSAGGYKAAATKYKNQAEILQQQLDLQLNRITQSQSKSMSERIIGTTQFTSTGPMDTLDQTGKYSDKILTAFLSSKQGLGMSEVKDMNAPVNVDTSLNNLEKVIQKMHEIKGTGKGLDNFIIDFDASLQKLTPEEVDKLEKTFNELRNTLGLTDADVGELSTQFELLKKGGKDAEGASKVIKKALLDIKSGCDLTTIDLEQLSGEMLETFVEIGMGRDDLEQLINKFDLSGEAAEKLRQKFEALKNASKGLEFPTTMTKGQAFGTLIGQAGQLAGSISMAVSAFQMLGSVFDENADPMTRIVSLFSALSMLLPLITTLTNMDTIEKTANAIQTLFQAGAQDASNKEKTKGALATALLTDKEAMATAAKNGETGATLLLAGAEAILNAETLVAIGLYALFIVAVLAIIAAIAAVVIVIQSFVNILDAHNRKLEETTKQAEQAKTAMEEMKTAYDDLKKSLEDYNKAQNAIATLRKETEEWRDAVAESNQQVLDLMDKFDGLGQYITPEGGILKITEAGQEWILNKQQKQAEFAVQDYYIAEQSRLEAKSDKLTTDRMLKPMLAATLSSVALSSVVPSIISPIINSIIGYTTGSYIGRLSTLPKSDEELLKWQQEVNDSWLSKLSIIEDAYNASIDEIEDWVKNVKEINKELEAMKTAQYDIILSDMGVETGSKAYGKELQRVIHDQLEQDLQNIPIDTNGLRTASPLAAMGLGGSVTTLISNYVPGGNELLGAGTSGMDILGLNDWGWMRTRKGEELVEKYIKLSGQDVDIDDVEFTGTGIKLTDESGEKSYEDIARAVAIDDFKTNDPKGYANQINQQIFALEALYNNADNQMAKAVQEIISEGSITTAELNEEQRKLLANGGLTEELLADFGLTQKQREAIGATGDALKDLNEKIKEAAGNYDSVAAEIERTKRDMAEAQTIIEANAEALGVTSNMLDVYAEKLLENQGELKDNRAFAARTAVAHLQLAQGLQRVQEAFEKHSETLATADKNSLDYAEALGDLQAALEQTFGLKVSAKTIETQMVNIQKAAEGDVEALQTLRKELNKSFIDELNIEQSDKNKITKFFEELQNQATDLEFGANFNIDGQKDIFNLFNEMLAHGEITVTELSGLFRNMDIEMPELHDYDIKGKPSTTTTTVTRKYTSGDKEGQEESWEDTVTTTPMISGFYFGDNKPILNEDTGRYTSNISSTNTVGNFKKTSTPSSLSSALKYRDKDKDKGSSDKELKSLEEEAERYHVIDKTLERLNKEYDKIAKAKDRAFGKKHLNYLEQEIKQTEKLAEATEIKLAEAQANLIKDREAMMKYGMSTDEYGHITNYEQLIAAQIAQYNTNPEAYEDSYSQFMNEISQYEETLALVEDLKTELADYADQQMDQALERIQYEVELQIRLSDMDLERLEWQIDNLTDSASDLAKKFHLLGQSMQANELKAQSSQDAIYKILAQNNLTMADIEGKSPQELQDLLRDKNFTESQIAELETQMNNLYSVTNEMEDLVNAIPESLTAAFADMNEEFDQTINKIEHLNSMIDAYRNIIDLAGADALGISGQLLEQMAQTQFNIANSNIEVAKKQLEQNQAYLNELSAEITKLEQEGRMEEAKKLKEAYDEIYATVQENETALLDKISTALEARTNLFETEMNNIFKTFEKALSGAYGTFNALQESFNQQKELNKLYIDDYEKIYELSKLNRDLVKSIDDTDSIRAKERLRDLQEEINDLQSSNTEMTQYEVKELRARYELRLAEIALEEAQNAKSQVRMRRDSEGNWSYVYTADEAAVGNAEQNYEDKLYAYQEILQDNIDEMQDRLIAIPQEWAEKTKAISEDTTLSIEEYNLRLAETNSYYETLQAHLLDQLRGTVNSSKTLYEEDWKSYSNLTGYKLAEDYKWRDEWNETILAQKMGLSSLEDVQALFQINTGATLNKLSGSYSNYRADVKNTLDNSLDDIEQFVGDENTPDSLAYYLKMAAESAEASAESAKDMAEENKEAFKGVAQAAGESLKNYSSIVEQWNTKTSTITSAVGNIIAAYSRLDGKLSVTKGEFEKLENQAKSTLDAMITASNYSGTPTDPTSSTKATSWRPEQGDYVTIPKGITLYQRNNLDNSLYNSGKSSVLSSTKWQLKGNTVNWNNKKYYQIHSSEGVFYVPEDVMTYVGDERSKFDTGGYTGSWDSSGRLAMLHQKELVLNASDTVNFLSAVDILRDITKIIDLQALSQSNMMSAITSASVGTAAQVIEQDVTIHAEFPNATNHSEIEAAFDTLLTRASQFANRKNK